jgi:hypothetical protein
LFRVLFFAFAKGSSSLFCATGWRKKKHTEIFFRKFRLVHSKVRFFVLGNQDFFCLKRAEVFLGHRVFSLPRKALLLYFVLFLLSFLPWRWQVQLFMANSDTIRIIITLFLFILCLPFLFASRVFDFSRSIFCLFCCVSDCVRIVGVGWQRVEIMVEL